HIGTRIWCWREHAVVQDEGLLAGGEACWCSPSRVCDAVPGRQAVRPAWCLIGWVMGSMDVATWVTLPFAGERLASVVHMGNGKDADLLLTFADGRQVTLPVSAMRVELAI